MSQSVATVTLTHIASGGSVTLPSPTLGANIETVTNQSIQRSASGDLRSYRHGPARFRATRTFEMMSENAVKALMDLLETAGWVGGMFVYTYKDTRDENTLRTPTVKLIEPPSETRNGMNLIDVTLVFEHTQHPDAETDRSAIG